MKFEKEKKKENNSLTKSTIYNNNHNVYRQLLKIERQLYKFVSSVLVKRLAGKERLRNGLIYVDLD